MNTYFNGHAHTYYSNVATPDVIISPQELIDRTIELGHTAITATDHGNVLSKYEMYDLATKAGLKYIYGVEAYFVLDSKSNDAKNGHIILYAINDIGYIGINRIISNANTDGFYYKARIDLQDLKSLDPKSVIITSACVGGFLNKYREETDFILKELQPFIDNNNFYLEVAYHDTEKQKEYNKYLLKLSKEKSIPLVFGADTHIIDALDVKYRDAFLLSKGISYEDEYGWMIDFPSYDIAVKRFIEQSILTTKEITDAMTNTNVIADKIIGYEILKDKNMKIPIIKDLRSMKKEERNNEFERIVWEEFDKKINIGLSKEENEKYKKQIQDEIDEILGCDMADYFIFNYNMVKLGREKYDGVLTYTGRGSCASFITCMLLGFTTIDRNKYNVPILPERFITKDRILLSKTPPDIDFNTASPKPFYRAQQDLIDENNTYPMIALGRLKEKSAWKIYAKANGIEFEIANKVSAQIEEYEKAKKYDNEDDHIDDDDYIPVNIQDYISAEYWDIYSESNRFLGVVTDLKVHPCAYIVADRNVIDAIGLIKAKDFICVGIEGKNAEKYGYLKNDLLTVSVVDIIDKIYKKIGMPQHTTTELLNIVDEKTWDIYKNGHTIEVNQMAKPSTRDKGKIYSPKTITDLSTLVAVVRPGSASIVDKVLKRQKYTFGVKEIDDILFSHTGVGSYVIFQESIMAMLEYAGIDKKETYDLLKSISKKRKEIIMQSKEKFINGIIDKIMKGK